MNRPRILVTGSSGYIGSNFIRRSRKVAKIKGLDMIDGEFTNFVTDMSDKLTLAAVVNKVKPSVIIHLAAKIQVGESQYKPDIYWKHNFIATMNLLDVIREINPDIRLIFMSSAAVYGHSDTELTTNSETKPVSVYGETKLACEMLIRSYCEAYGLTAAVTRLFNVGGGIRSTDSCFHLIPIAIRCILTEDTFSIFGNDYDTKDGTCERSYVHVYDLIDTIMNIINSDPKVGSYIVYNVSATSSHTVTDIISNVIEITDKKMLVKISDRRDGDPGRLISKITPHDLEVLECNFKLTDIITDEWNSRKKSTINKSKDVGGIHATTRTAVY